jgi:hypothetical protein
MKLHIEWMRPLALSNGSHHNLIYTCAWEELPQQAGVYVFGRRNRNYWEALYVGKAGSIRRRVRSQLKNLPLMLHVQNAKAGHRVVLVGRFIAKPGQRKAKCKALLERALIRHFLSINHDLVNIMGTRLRQHEITSSGAKRMLPDMMVLER